jgi:hypothetical protein
MEEKEKKAMEVDQEEADSSKLINVEVQEHQDYKRARRAIEELEASNAELFAWIDAGCPDDDESTTLKSRGRMRWTCSIGEHVLTPMHRNRLWDPPGE